MLYTIQNVIFLAGDQITAWKYMCSINRNCIPEICHFDNTLPKFIVKWTTQNHKVLIYFSQRQCWLPFNYIQHVVEFKLPICRIHVCRMMMIWWWWRWTIDRIIKSDFLILIADESWEQVKKNTENVVLASKCELMLTSHMRYAC